MKRVYVLCEGQTEERFVQDVLFGYLQNSDILLIPVVIATKRTLNEKFKGGIVSYEKQIKKEILLLCSQHPNELVTTMIDYYGLPEDTPSVNSYAANVYEKVGNIESAVESDIGRRNFICYISVHEFESLLFSEPKAFECIADSDAVEKLTEMKDAFGNAELINNSSETAPSKRILKTISTYSKTLHGIRVSGLIGIDKMKSECPHFRDWLTKIQGI